MTNWIPDINRCKLSAPPEWWLKGLADFDADLVLIPSRQEMFVYRVARRATKSQGIGTAVIAAVDRQADTVMLAQHRLVPVTTIRTMGTWSYNNLYQLTHTLADRDIWRHGGASKVAERLDMNDQQERMKVDATIAADADYRARDAWRSLQARTGQRVLHPGLTPRPSEPAPLRNSA